MRLIDADELTRKWQEVLALRADKKDSVAYLTFELFIDRLKDEPTIEAVPVKHGKWDMRKYNSEGECIEHCSNCDLWSSEHDKCYCPICGSKMDLEG